MNYIEKKTCRLCNSENLNMFLDLGMQPLSNSYIEYKSLNKQEEKYPLKVNICRDCNNIQLSIVVKPEIMYKNYLYVSGTPNTFHKHCQDLADKCTKQLDLKEFDLVVDIAGNDGTLLSKFINQNKFINVVSIDPAKNLAETAREKGVDVFSLFFNSQVAKKVKEKYNKKAKLITAQNVFAHIDDLKEFIKEVDELLDDNGTLIIEFPYALNMFQTNAFDTIYHEHLSYFLLKPLVKFFLANNYKIYNIEYFDKLHGGTIRLIVNRFNKFTKQSQLLTDFLSIEFIDPQLFVNTIYNSKPTFLTLLAILKNDHKKVHFFGSSAKGNTYLNYMLGDNLTDYLYFRPICYDENPLKQGYYLPGTRVFIESPNLLYKKEMHPDYIFITVWNFADEIIKRIREKYNYEGKFIIPIPYLRII